MTLPTLTVNRAFMTDFLEPQSPCFALGLVDIEGNQTGFLAMRPQQPIPSETTAAGFNFGHALLGFDNTLLCQFMFDFQYHSLYTVIVNPAVPTVRHIIETMVERGDYMFFNLNPGGKVQAFRTADRKIAGVADNLPHMQSATTTDEEYEKAVQLFRENPDPPGEVLNWVCRDNPDYLDLTEDTISLTPTGS